MEKKSSKLSLYNKDHLLSQADENTFWEFFKNLKSSRKVRFIYRGTNKLKKQYNVETSNIPVLSSYIFMIGEKGKAFSDTHIREYNTLKFIWEKINIICCTMTNDNNVSKFLNKNQNFKEYFSDNNNKEHFLNLNTHPHKKKIIDYYLVFLHTVGKRLGNDNSYFLSTSAGYETAHTFANNGGIILYGWVPRKGLKQQIIDYEDVNKYNEFIEAQGLPAYKIAMYPKQEEICLKCGLLPHFIIGFQDQDKFYINPNILTTRWDDNIVYNGINVDQTKFDEVIRHTRYKRTAFCYDGNYYILQDGCKKEI